MRGEAEEYFLIIYGFFVTGNISGYNISEKKKEMRNECRKS